MLAEVGQCALGLGLLRRWSRFELAQTTQPAECPNKFVWPIVSAIPFLLLATVGDGCIDEQSRVPKALLLAELAPLIWSGHRSHVRHRRGRETSHLFPHPRLA